MSTTFEEQVSIFRSIANMRRLSVLLTPLARGSNAEKFSPMHKRGLAELLDEIDQLVPGCPADAVLYRHPRQSDEARGAWEQELRAAVDPEEERVADLFTEPSQ